MDSSNESIAATIFSALSDVTWTNESPPGSDAKQIIAPRALKRADGGGDLSSGISQPQHSAKPRQSLNATEACDFRSQKIMSSMQLTNAMKNRRDEAKVHQPGMRQKFSGAEEPPNSWAAATQKQGQSFSGSKTANIQNRAWRGLEEA